MEGLTGVLRNKGTREYEPVFREQGNKTVQIRGRKHFDVKNKERNTSEIVFISVRNIPKFKDRARRCWTREKKMKTAHLHLTFALFTSLVTFAESNNIKSFQVLANLRTKAITIYLTLMFFNFIPANSAK